MDWPRSWSGWWVAADGKAVLLEPAGDGGALVTVSPSLGGAPYPGAQRLDGGARPVSQLEATCGTSEDGGCFLEVEAGTPGLGPTYRLHARLAGDRPAPATAAAAEVVLRPARTLGLYDDYDDDGGIPWSEPLLELEHTCGRPVHGPPRTLEHPR